jgi:hypothetical protein
MGGDNLTEMIGKAARGIPGRPSVAKSFIRTDVPPKHLQVFIDALDVATNLWYLNFDEFGKITGKASDEMFSGSRPVADSVKDMVPQINKLLPT